MDGPKGCRLTSGIRESPREEGSQEGCEGCGHLMSCHSQTTYYYIQEKDLDTTALLNAGDELSEVFVCLSPVVWVHGGFGVRPESSHLEKNSGLFIGHMGRGSTPMNYRTKVPERLHFSLYARGRKVSWLRTYARWTLPHYS